MPFQGPWRCTGNEGGQECQKRAALKVTGGRGRKREKGPWAIFILSCRPNLASLNLRAPTHSRRGEWTARTREWGEEIPPDGQRFRDPGNTDTRSTGVFAGGLWQKNPPLTIPGPGALPQQITSSSIWVGSPCPPGRFSPSSRARVCDCGRKGSPASPRPRGPDSLVCRRCGDAGRIRWGDRPTPKAPRSHIFLRDHCLEGTLFLSPPMDSVKDMLAAAAAELARGAPRDALKLIKAALAADRACSEAYVLAGAAADALGEYGQVRTRKRGRCSRAFHSSLPPPAGSEETRHLGRSRPDPLLKGVPRFPIGWLQLLPPPLPAHVETISPGRGPARLRPPLFPPWSMTAFLGGMGRGPSLRRASGPSGGQIARAFPWPTKRGRPSPSCISHPPTHTPRSRNLRGWALCPLRKAPLPPPSFRRPRSRTARRSGWAPARPRGPPCCTSSPPP